MVSKRNIIGRYAPSPTGDLHLGNLRTALVAWLHARLQGGKFLLRMEDLDTPRVVKGSDDAIISDLQWLGIDWDGDIIYQSDCLEYYQAAIELLMERDLVYECFCSRKDIRSAASAPHQQSLVYPGTCSRLSVSELQQRRVQKEPALRLRTPDRLFQFNDLFQGIQNQNLATHVGDFVIKRADGLFAYQLAVVVDDLRQKVSEVVRGADLIDSTVRQLYLGEVLGPSPISYGHVPLMMDEFGKRMAKRDGSHSIAQWRQQGRNKEELIGLLAHSVDLRPDPSAISLSELYDELDIDFLKQKLCI